MDSAFALVWSTLSVKEEKDRDKPILGDRSQAPFWFAPQQSRISLRKVDIVGSPIMHAASPIMDLLQALTIDIVTIDIVGSPIMHAASPMIELLQALTMASTSSLVMSPAYVEIWRKLVKTSYLSDKGVPLQTQYCGNRGYSMLVHSHPESQKQKYK